jgi:EAL domain-containing protein (putative c-di-GMP-specific phosphodiesterase class I)
MDRLRPRGCRFILDNCAGGSVVFSELRYLPVDYLKIRDRLVRDSGTDPVAARVLTAVVEVAHLLERRVVALGVEDAHTLERLRALGLDACQGFHLSHPWPLATLLAQKR